MSSNSTYVFQADKKRIAKNTLLLYFRMGIIILVSLYTSRIVIGALGISDYGIYSLVSGIVIFFTFLNGAMSSSTQRFLNFEMGRNNITQTRKIFSMSLIIHIIIAFVVVLLAETIGLWIVNCVLKISPERVYAANIVYQFSVAAIALKIACIPYNATIIAHERMSFYAYISILESAMKLIAAYLLLVCDSDRLVLYSVLGFATAVIEAIIRIAYCTRHFETSKLIFSKDGKLFKELIGFSGWSVFGASGNIANSQGINIILNLFCGVTANAAMGIANQIGGTINNFLLNFQTSFNPSLVKSYASGDEKQFIRLLFQSSKFSYYLMFFFSLPVLINTDEILYIWLKIVPEYTSGFAQWIIICALIDAITGPLWMSIQAYGKIRNYQLIITFIILLNIPISIFILWIGIPPVYVFVSKALLGFSGLIWRIFYLEKKINLPVSEYLKDVILVIISVSILASLIPLALKNCVAGMTGSILSFLLSMVCLPIVIWFVGISKDEKFFLRNVATKIIRRKNTK